MTEIIEEKSAQTEDALEVSCAGAQTEELLKASEDIVSEQDVQDVAQPQNVVVNIDYEKLAEAIIQAQKKASEELNTAKEKETEVQILPKKHWWDIFSAIGHILSGKGSKNGAFTAAPFAWIVSFIYRAIAVLGTVGIVALDVEFVKIIKINVVQGLPVIGVIIFVIVVAFISFTAFCCMVIFWGASDDIKKEQDKNYIMSVFSGMMSVAALIVAIAALVKVK